MVTETFNPIIKEEAYKAGFFPIIPVPGPKRAILLYSSVLKGRPLIILNETIVKTSDIRKGKYDQLAEIDLHPNNIRFKEELASDDSVSKFSVTVSATAIVTEPDVVYEEQISDVARLVSDTFVNQLQDMASDHSIRDVAGLKYEIKDALGDGGYVGKGISIQNINVVVKSDEKYEQLVRSKTDLDYKLELERKKAESSKELYQMYQNDVVAIFSEMAAGNITAEEAVKKTKEGLSKDFDERLRQIRAATEYIKELEKDDMIDKDNTLRKVKDLLNGLVTSIPSVSEISQKEQKQLAFEEEEEKEQSFYEPFDDED